MLLGGGGGGGGAGLLTLGCASSIECHRTRLFGVKPMVSLKKQRYHSVFKKVVHKCCQNYTFIDLM